MKTIIIAITAVSVMSLPASASIRCTTIGTVTRCFDSDTSTTTRCTTIGTVTRCTTY